MSNALAVAGVTAVLRGMLDTWLSDQDASAALGGADAQVTAVAPDTIKLGVDTTPRLNLFLHQVSLNSGWRQVDLPARDARGRRVGRPPLALDLHYLLTAYGSEQFQAEVLLGYGMQLLHEVQMLDRDEIEARLPTALRPSQLGRQVELIKITPAVMGTDELSKLWSALQSHYRPTAPYHVSVVLIDSEAEARRALPVLRPVVGAASSLEPVLPGITAIRPPDSQPAAELGQTVTVEGHHLDGTDRAVRLENARLGIEREVVAISGNEAGLLRFAVPNAPAALAVGTYSLRALVQRTGEASRRETNRLGLTIAPRIVTPTPINVIRNAEGTATVAISCRPSVRPHQRAALILGEIEVSADDHPAPTTSLTFSVPDAPVGSHLFRVRVDGIDSLLVDRSVTPPAFLDRRVVVA